MMSYEFTLAPLTIRGKTLKSHMIHSRCYNMFGDTPEDFRKATNFYCGLASAGAATVTLSVGTFPDCEGQRSIMSNMEMDDPAIAAQFTRMIDEIHQYGTNCSASLMNVEPQQYSIFEMPQAEWDAIPKVGDYNPNFINKPAISLERAEGMIQDYVKQCRALKDMGFDQVTFYMSYRASILATALSPVLNRRTDRYGGTTVAERARLPLEVFRRVREAVGENFLIEVQISGEEEAPGYTVGDWLEFCALCDDYVDIWQVRGWEGSCVHVTGYNSSKERPFALKYAEAFKGRNLKAKIAPVGGFGDPDMMERFLREEKTDLISMARGFMCDPHRAEKLREGRGADITPCLRCMKCLHPSCPVNPELTLMESPGIFPDKKETVPKKVAVIGGGAAGMRAALEAARLGHQVTLYEKSGVLGGQMQYAYYQDFKWQFKDFLEWLIRQVQGCGAELRLNTEAVPEQIRGEGYDVVILALGSLPKAPPVPGAEGTQILRIDDVYSGQAEIGRRVVVVGGGDSGRETALYLAQSGRQVTLLTRSQQGFTDNNHCIYGTVQAYVTNPNLEIVEFAKTTRIEPHAVSCTVKTNMPRRKLTFDSVSQLTHRPQEPVEKIPGLIYPEFPDTSPKMPVGGLGKNGRKTGFPHPREEIVAVDARDIVSEERVYTCDTVIVAGGRTARTEEAKAFVGVAPRVYIVGDNIQPGSLLECATTAYAAVRAI